MYIQIWGMRGVEEKYVLRSCLYCFVNCNEFIIAL